MADYGMTRNGSGYWDETPVQQDEVKGALPLSTLPEGFHPSGLPFCDHGVNTESGEYAHGCTSAQKQAREHNSNVAPDGRKNQAKPAGHPFCDQRLNTEREEYAHGSTVNDPNVSGAENPSNVAPDGRIKGTKSPKPAKVVSA